MPCARSGQADDKTDFPVRSRLSVAVHKLATCVQEVVTNLMISRIEVREETHPDVVRHVHPRHVEVVTVSLTGGELADVRGQLIGILRKIINQLVRAQVSTGPKMRIQTVIMC